MKKMNKKVFLFFEKTAIPRHRKPKIELQGACKLNMLPAFFAVAADYTSET